jgi:hypothetical protein
MTAKIFQVCAWALSATALAAWGQPVKPPAGKGTDAEPKVEISVFPPDKHRTIGGGFDLYVTVTNAGRETIKHQGVDLCFPRAIWSLINDGIREMHVIPLEKAEAKKKAEASNAEAKQADAKKQVEAKPYDPCWRPERQTPGQREGFDIPPGRQAYFHLDVPKVEKVFSLDDVLFRRDNYTVQAFAMYQLPGDRGDARVVRAEKAIEFRPSLIAPLSGVLVGTLLVAAFIALRRTSQKFTALMESGRFDHRKFALAVLDYCWIALRVSISGIISGMILVVVLNQTDAQQLPVTVSINDFWGGAFLGLIAYKLSDWLDEKFFAQKTADAPGKKA